MKRKLTALILTVFLATSFITPAFAAETDGLTAKAGITPDSILYKVDLAVEGIKVALTSGDVNKAKEMLNNAEERLAEVQAMVDKNKVELAKKTAEEYAKEMDEANKKAEDAIDKDGGKKSGDKDSVDLSKNIDEFLNAFTSVDKNSTKVLADVYDKLSSDQARMSIVTNIVRQTLHADALAKYKQAREDFKAGKINSDQLAIAKTTFQNVKETTQDIINDWLKGTVPTTGTPTDADKTNNGKALGKDKDKKQIEDEINKVTEEVKNKLQEKQNVKAQNKEKVQDEVQQTTQTTTQTQTQTKGNNGNGNGNAKGLNK